MTTTADVGEQLLNDSVLEHRYLRKDIAVMIHSKGGPIIRPVLSFRKKQRNYFIADGVVPCAH